MDGWLTEITTWLVELVKSIFKAVADFFADQLVALFDLVAAGLLALLGALPVPAFMGQGGGLGSLLGNLPPFVLYLVSKMQLGQALAVIGAGVVFRLGRKLVTLGQW